jgi:hypothetical protein
MIESREQKAESSELPRGRGPYPYEPFTAFCFLLSALSHFTTTVFQFTNSLTPASPSSRP